METGTAPSAAVVTALKDALLDRQARCFLCKWILADLAENGRLTGQPHQYGGIPIFPAKSKVEHLKLEGIVFELE
jgi:hypothetical protein